MENKGNTCYLRALGTRNKKEEAACCVVLMAHNTRNTSTKATNLTSLVLMAQSASTPLPSTRHTNLPRYLKPPLLRTQTTLSKPPSPRYSNPSLEGRLRCTQTLLLGTQTPSQRPSPRHSNRPLHGSPRYSNSPLHGPLKGTQSPLSITRSYVLNPPSPWPYAT